MIPLGLREGQAAWKMAREGCCVAGMGHLLGAEDPKPGTPMIRGTTAYLRGGQSFPPSEGLVMAMMEWVPLMQPHGHTARFTLYYFQCNLSPP